MPGADSSRTIASRPKKIKASVVHACTYPGSGGAGIAALRLIDALEPFTPQFELVGVCSDAATLHPHVHALVYGRSPLEAIWRRLRSRQCYSDQAIIRPASSTILAGFFTDRSAHGWALARAINQADLIHFHWVNDLLDYACVLPRIRPLVPLVWTLHDMSAFTGGCCYALNCDGFQQGCGTCPQLGSDLPTDFSSLSLKRRIRALHSVRDRLHLVAPSAWMAERATASEMFAGLPCTVIPNAVDLGIFHPRHRNLVRSELGLHQDTALLLFAAASLSNPVKGMETLISALPHVVDFCTAPVQIMCVGSESRDLSPHVRSLGRITDQERLAGLYAAADLLIVPSLIDNAPNVIAEAHACGLPVLASAVGGIPEMIEPNLTGGLFPSADSAELAFAINRLLPAVMADRAIWSARCRAMAEQRYAPMHVAQRHLELYHDALDQVDRHRI